MDHHPPLLDHLRALRALCAVAASGSTVAAADAMHRSQSSVVRAVQSLEASLGQALFERSGRGMRPTSVGGELALRTGRALMHLAQADTPSRRGAGVDALYWTASRLAAGVTARHMDVLLSLAQTGTEVESARALGISQPAVHQTLAQLEHMAGHALFIRARKGLRPTEAGDAVEQAFRLARAELQQAGDALAARRGVVQGRLAIGTLPFSTGHLLSGAVDRVLRSHPGLAVTIVDGTYDALVQQLRRADIDLIVGALRPTLPAADLVQEPLFSDRLAVIVRASHPLARRPRLTWADLREAAWIMPMPRTPAQQAFEQALLAADLPLPADALRVNSALMMQALLVQTDRLALMSPSHLRDQIAAGLLAELPVPVQHEPRMIGLVRRADYLPTPGAQALLVALRDVASALGSV